MPCPPELDGLEILAVDDEEDAREMLRSLLEACGARVRVSTSAAEALRELIASVPAVLLSDIGMPEEDGYCLVTEVAACRPTRGGEVAAIALTAYARSEEPT